MPRIVGNLPRIVGRLLLICGGLPLVFGSLSLVACVHDEVAPSRDVLAPARVEDLAAEVDMTRTVVLTWTAPLEYGISTRASRYEIRRSDGPLTEWRWAEAVPIPAPGRPAEPGFIERWEAYGLPDGRWRFALRSADEAGNWSAISNVVEVDLADTIPPGPVASLAVDAVAAHSITLQWRAPGNDGGQGRADRYDIRFSTVPITPETWMAATPVDDVPLPGAPRSMQRVTVDGLPTGEVVYFGMKTIDAAGNESTISNIAPGVPRPMMRLTWSDRPVQGPSNPSWSPDGESIAFHAAFSGIDWVFRVPPSGGTPAVLSDRTAFDMAPDWSPEGDRVMVARGHVDDITIRRLAIYSLDASPPTEIFEQADRITHCAWSPDGARVAFTTWRSPDLFRIYLVSSDGGSAEPWGDGPGAYASWSPDGTWIAFESNRSGSADIWVAPADGGVSLPLTSGSAYEGMPAWSPDGSRLAFVSSRTGALQVWAMRPDGSDPVQVTYATGAARAPTWSPDGDRICFALSRTYDAALDHSELWVVDFESAPTSDHDPMSMESLSP